MRFQATAGIVLVKFGKRFAAPEAERLQQIVSSPEHLSQLTLDFTDVRDFHDAAFVPLAKTLSAISTTKVVLHGLTRHHSRMLGYLGVGLRSTRPLALA